MQDKEVHDMKTTDRLARHDKKLSYRRDSAGRLSLRRSRSFKVTDFGANRKPVCDFLLVNNTNLNSGYIGNKTETKQNYVVSVLFQTWLHVK